MAPCCLLRRGCRSRFLYHSSISLFRAHLCLPDPPCYFFSDISSEGRDFLSFLISFLPICAPELLSPSGVFMKSQGLAEVHASVTCLFSHQEGEARGRGGERADCQSGGAEEGIVIECTLTFPMVLGEKCATVRLNASVMLTQSPLT